MELEIKLKSLVEHIKTDERYFTEFFKLTKKQIFYNIFSILKDFHASEDILQETYLTFLNNINSINTSKSILGYLYRISKNKAIDYYRKNKKLLDYELIDNQLELSYQQEFDHSQELLLKIKKILNDIEYRVIVLHIINELTNKEIGKIINRPTNTVIWIYNKAIKKIRESLGDEYV